MKKRYICLLLVICMLIGCIPALTTNAAALASDDYTQWKQSDPEWNQAEAWPYAESHLMSESGCWITSVAMLMRHYGVAPSTNVNEFNPWICNEALVNSGDVNSNGDMVYGTMCKAYPDFPFACEYPYSFEKLKEQFDAGYACMVEVQNGQKRHMVAVRYVSPDGTVTIMDPGNSYTNLDAYGTKYRFLCFGPFSVVPTSETYVYTDAQAYLTQCPSVPYSAKVEVVNGTNLKTLPCSADTNSNSETVRAAVVGETLQVSACLINTANNFWYQTEVDGQTCYIYSDNVVSLLSNIDESLTSVKVWPRGRISLKDGPYSAAETVKTAWLWYVKVVGYVINRYGNVWFYTDDGQYLYSGDCKGYSFELPSLELPTRDVLQLSGSTVPESISQGSYFIVRGTVTSGESEISSLTVGVYDEAGNLATGKTVEPNALSYDIHEVDADIRFDWLSSGTYSYRVTATNASGTETLCDVPFTVN